MALWRTNHFKSLGAPEDVRKIWRQSNYAKWGKMGKGAKVFSRHLVMGSIPDYRDKCFVLLYTPERRSRRRISLTKMPCCSEQHGGWVVKKGVWSRVWTRIIKKLTKNYWVSAQVRWAQSRMSIWRGSILLYRKWVLDKFTMIMFTYKSTKTSSHSVVLVSIQMYETTFESSL